MARKRYKPEEIVAKLRPALVGLFAAMQARHTGGSQPERLARLG
jgi:hypothetical protein